MSALQKSVLKSALAGYALPPRNAASARGFGKNRLPRDFSPVHWSKYFEKKDIISVNGDKFCVYSVFSSTGAGIPVIVLLHGGGFSALTWAVMAKVLSTFIEAQIIAIDLRGHGETDTSNDGDLSADTMSSDIVGIIRELNLRDNPLVLVGHSLGGSLAVHSAQKILEEQEFHIVAVAVIDVVEGSAIESLSNMHSILKQRPKSFPTLTRAIEWAMKAGVIKSVDSARVSMPSQLKVRTTNEPATNHVSTKDDLISPENDKVVPSDPEPSTVAAVRADVIAEEEGDEEPASPTPSDTTTFDVPSVPPPNKDSYIWRIDLHKTEPFWHGWFKGMSSKFLALQCPKLLMLAGIDRLDRDLTVGQMQGKFQMQVIANVGHAVHEDSPAEVAESVCSFLVRHKLVEAKREFHPVFPGC